MGCLGSKEGGGDAGEKTKTKSKQAAKKIVKTLDGLEWKGFKKLDLADIDEWFSSVAEVVDSVAALGEACDTANEGVLQLCEAKEMIDDGVEEKSVKSVLVYLVKTTKVKNCEIVVSIDGDGKIKFEVTGEGCGAGWLIFDGVRKLVDALNTFVEEMPELIPKMEEFVTQSEELPDKIQAGAQSLSPMKVPGTISAGTNNIKQVAAIPKVMKTSLESVKNLMVLIVDILQGKEVTAE